MKVIITHLKAPWPEKAGVGDIIDLPEPTPVWAEGKFKPAEPDAKVTVKYKAPPALEAPDEAINVDPSLATQLASVTAERDALNAERDSLKADVESGGKALEAALKENAELQAKVDAQGKASSDTSKG